LANETATTPTVVTKSRPNDQHKYEKASHLLFGVFTKDFPEERFKSGGVVRGFNVAFWLAAWSIRAYKEHIKQLGDNGGGPNELGKILLRSYDPAVTTFSSTTNNKNKVLERAFGLNTYLSPAYEPIPFRIVSSNSGNILSPSEMTLRLAMLELEYKAVDEIASVGRCPASGRMLHKVWAATIDTCVNSDSLFPYDLEHGA
jgi:hypothetical protein